MPDMDLQKTGGTGRARDRNGRFCKGRSGNPAGRPSRARHRGLSKLFNLNAGSAADSVYSAQIESNRSIRDWVDARE